MRNEDLDKLFRDGLKDEAPAFREEAWDKMAGTLDAADGTDVDDLFRDGLRNAGWSFREQAWSGAEALIRGMGRALWWKRGLYGGAGVIAIAGTLFLLNPDQDAPSGEDTRNSFPVEQELNINNSLDEDHVFGSETPLVEDTDAGNEDPEIADHPDGGSELVEIRSDQQKEPPVVDGRNTDMVDQAPVDEIARAYDSQGGGVSTGGETEERGQDQNFGQGDAAASGNLDRSNDTGTTSANSSTSETEIQLEQAGAETAHKEDDHDLVISQTEEDPSISTDSDSADKNNEERMLGETSSSGESEDNQAQESTVVVPEEHNSVNPPALGWFDQDHRNHAFSIELGPMAMPSYPDDFGHSSWKLNPSLGFRYSYLIEPRMTINTGLTYFRRSGMDRRLIYKDTLYSFGVIYKEEIEEVLHIHYLQIPLSVAVQVHPGHYIEMGAYVAMGLNMRSHSVDTLTYTNGTVLHDEWESNEWNTSYRKWDGGLMLAYRYRFGENWAILLRGQYGIIDQTVGQHFEYQSKDRNAYIMLLLEYRL